MRPGEQPVCFIDVADKNRRWPREFLVKVAASFAQAVGNPADFSANLVAVADWLNQVDLRPVWRPRLRFGDKGAARKLHELVRASIPYVYRGDTGCDYVPAVRPVGDILQGADCDETVFLIALAAYFMGFPQVDLVAIGVREPGDRYQHVFAVVHGTYQNYVLDAKGDDVGADFNVLPKAPLYTSWEFYKHDDRPGGRV